jgi:hypothetical protein
MALDRAYAAAHPELDPFLYSELCDETDGAPLSVLSALARLDLDPRDEAVRLSRLTKEAATEQLARMIARLPDTGWTLSEVRRIATRLIELLPSGTGRYQAAQVPVRADRKTGKRASMFAMYLVLAGAVLLTLIAQSGLFSQAQVRPQPAPHSNSTAPPNR